MLITTLCNLVSSEKHLGMDLDTKLDFQEHLDNIMSKVDKNHWVTQ